MYFEGRCLPSCYVHLIQYVWYDSNIFICKLQSSNFKSSNHLFHWHWQWWWWLRRFPWLWSILVLTCVHFNWHSAENHSRFMKMDFSHTSHSVFAPWKRMWCRGWIFKYQLSKVNHRYSLFIVYSFELLQIDVNAFYVWFYSNSYGKVFSSLLSRMIV